MCVYTFVQGSDLSQHMVPPLPSRSLSRGWSSVKNSSTSVQKEFAHSVLSPKSQHSAGVLLVVVSLGKKAVAKKVLNGRKRQSQSSGEQEIVSSTRLLGRFMKKGEQSFPWKKDREADYDTLYFIVFPEKEPRALFSA